MIVRNNTKFKNVSSRLRHAGLVYGLGSKLGTSITLEELDVMPDSNEQGAYEAMRQRLAQSAPPDAVFSANDTMALGTIRALQEAGLHLPDEISVVAGMGDRLLDLLLRRIALKGISLPAEILPSSFLPGDSTRPEENDMLAAAFSAGRENLSPGRHT
jgi:DNA-binding LacI/PurR family transcriptional regulator